jgi:hypothetical protein
VVGKVSGCIGVKAIRRSYYCESLQGATRVQARPFAAAVPEKNIVLRQSKAIAVHPFGAYPSLSSHLTARLPTTWIRNLCCRPFSLSEDGAGSVGERSWWLEHQHRRCQSLVSILRPPETSHLANSLCLFQWLQLQPGACCRRTVWYVADVAAHCAVSRRAVRWHLLHATTTTSNLTFWLFDSDFAAAASRWSIRFDCGGPNQTCR